MIIPKNVSNRQKRRLKKIYQKTLKENKGNKKAKVIAKVRVIEECFKMFNRKNSKELILENWNKTKKTIIKEKVDYKTYMVGKNKLLLSTDDKILEKFSNNRKGMLKDMDEDFEKDILFKAEEDYDIKIHPQMYYVILRNK